MAANPQSTNWGKVLLAWREQARQDRLERERVRAAARTQIKNTTTSKVSLIQLK